MSEPKMKPGSAGESPEGLFLAALDADSAKVQQCSECGKKFFQPRTHCPHCSSERYTWVPLTMAGSLHSFTNLPAKRESAAYNVVLVDMDDGFRMMSCCPGLELGMQSIGMRVSGWIDHDSVPPRIVFGATT
ncbi:OB-fold domain-containing protein [Comamonas aquatica]|nr:OB-fold domain-containing protein [Comamonas aquatica]